MRWWIQFNLNVPKSRIIDLATAHFVDRHENVLFVGPAGVGKSHPTQALGHRAVRRGHETLFLTAAPPGSQPAGYQARENFREIVAEGVDRGCTAYRPQLNRYRGLPKENVPVT